MVKSIHTHQRHSGFTLIEVLITIIVVSIGLLGLAGLQISGLRANMSSEDRSKATLLANDIAERIRTNSLGVDNTINDNQYANVTTTGQNCGDQPVPFCSNYNSGTATPASSCSPAQMATFDIWVWACGMPTANNVVPGGVTNILVNGTGSVTCNDLVAGDGDTCSPGSPHTITVTWDVLNPDTSGAPGTAATLPQSYSLVMVP